MGLISPVSRSRAEGELRGILVGAYHADPDDAACLAREAVMDSWSGKDPSVSIRPDWSKTQFERYAEICDIDLGDLWSNFD